MTRLLLAVFLAAGCATDSVYAPAPEGPIDHSMVRYMTKSMVMGSALQQLSNQVGGPVSGSSLCLAGKPLDCFTDNGVGTGFLSTGAISSGTTISIRNAVAGLSIGSVGTEMFRVDVLGETFSNATTGNTAFGATLNGARFDFGAGATDYASSDGTTVTFAGPVGSGTWTGGSSSSTAAFGYLMSDATATPTVCASTFAPNNALAAGDCMISMSDSAATNWVRLYQGGVLSQNAVIGTAASGTGITANYVGAVRGWSAKTTVINTALAAASTTDVTIATTPVNTRIVRVLAEVTQVFTGGALSAMTVTCGNAAGGNQYLLSGSVFTATTTLGDVVAEMGAGVVSSTLADMGTVSAGVPGAITVSCRFTCTGANCSAATQGSVAFIVEGTTY